MLLALALSPLPHAGRHVLQLRGGPMHLAVSIAPVELPEDAASTAASATSYFQPLQKGDVLHSSPEHRRICAAASLTVVAMVAKMVLLITWPLTLRSALGLAAAALAGLEFADFGSGVYHWSMDNYGNARTPVFGKQIEAFQGHHEAPWTITHRETCNNLHQPAMATLPPLLAYLFLASSPCTLMFGAVACTFIMCAQELHKWSHTVRSQASPLVNRLQDAGLVISRTAHLRHHRAPFDCNYCIVTGHCNDLLDKSLDFFSRLQRLVVRLNGVEARCITNERPMADRARAEKERAKQARRSASRRAR